MRCWDCKVILVLPEIIDGKPGIAGMLREGTDQPDKKVPQVVSQEIACHRCGAHYMITTARKPGFAKVERVEPVTEDRRERDRGWKG